KAEQSLYAVSAVTVIFIIIEFLGGYFANSLAIMTDAGHMVSDLLSFCVAIIAIKLAQKSHQNVYHLDIIELKYWAH
ncbi:hypothetical protein WUBG_03385, partial [Wuchereria bancrofti]